MKKRGAVQQRKEKINKITNYFLVLILVALLGILTAGMIQNYRIIRSWDQEEHNVYSGTYALEKVTRKTRHYSTKYVFELGNGDCVTVRDKYVDAQTFRMLSDILEEYGAESPVKLTFQYPSIQTAFSDSYEVFSLEDSADNVYILEDSMRISICKEINILFFLFVLALLLPVGYWLLLGFLIAGKLRKIMRKQKKKEKRQP